MRAAFEGEAALLEAPARLEMGRFRISAPARRKVGASTGWSDCGPHRALRWYVGVAVLFRLGEVSSKRGGEGRRIGIAARQDKHDRLAGGFDLSA